MGTVGYTILGWKSLYVILDDVQVRNVPHNAPNTYVINIEKKGITLDLNLSLLNKSVPNVKLGLKWAHDSSHDHIDTISNT